MSLSRYQVRNVYSLANPELYKAADTDDPEALLEGVAMAGLVGVIRQLGDLAEFAAEIFHGLHEEMTATAARSHGLLARVQQLELEIPSTEKAFLSQTCSSAFFPNSGINWHPNSNRQTSQNLITMGDLPRFVMESYEECRAPPRLFLLDKFDVGGAGACLKRYTDPSYYKVEVSSYEIESAETQRDIKIRKTKKKDSEWKRGRTHKVSQPSHIKLHQLFLEDCVQNGTIEPTRRVKLKKRPNKFLFDSETGQSYMSKLLNSPSKVKFVRQPPVYSSIIPLPSDTSERPTILIVEDPIGSDLKIRSPSVSPSVERDLTTSALSLAAGGGSFAFVEEVNEKQITVDETDVVKNGDQSDDVASETENYVDALATIELELETEAEFIAKTDDPNVNHGTYSDRHKSRNSTEITSIVGVDSPPRFTFASTEIPFRPRMPPQQVSIDEKICGTQHSDENYENPNTPNKHSDLLSTCDGLSSFKFVRNSDIEHHNDGFSSVIHLPNILETSLRIREDDHCTGSVDSSCGFPNSVISQPFGLSLAEHDPEKQLKETGDDNVLHIFDSKFSFFSHDESEKNNSKVQLVIGKDCVVLEDESELKEPKTESDHVSVPDDVNRNDENALSTLEDDTELEGKEMENSVVLLSVDLDKNEDNNARSTVEEPEATIFLQKQMEMEKNDDNVDGPSFMQDLAEITRNGEQEIEDKADLQLLVASGSSELLSQLDSGSYPIIQEEVPQGEPMTVPVPDTPPNGHDIDLFDQVKHQSHPEPYPTNLASQNVVQKEDPLGKPIIVSASENQPTFDLPQENSYDIELFDQVKHQLPPVFPGFGKLPKLPPVKLEDMPPLPPLPPMQWRMRKLENPLLTPTDSGQYNNGNFRFPPFFQSKSDEVSELAAGNKIPDTENQIFEHEPSLQTEAKFAENLDPQAAVETDSGSEIAYSNPPGDEMLTSIRPIKIQRPRSPLIDAVATHDKTKLRKASDRAMPHIPENNILLEQIRTKSFKLKPAVQTRPSIHSPTTNMRVAAILEKANAIRQAFAGSDDENDSWSD